MLEFREHRLTVKCRQNVAGALGNKIVLKLFVVRAVHEILENKLEVEVYQAAKNTLDFTYAGQLALTETTAASLFVVGYVLLGKKGRRTHAGVSSLPPVRVHGAAEYALLAVIGGAILLFLVLPLTAIVFTGAGDLIKLFSQKSFSTALLNTVTTSLGSASLCVVTAFFFACVARRADPYGKSILFRIVPLLPMAVSSVVIGFGLTNVLRRFHIAGSPVMLVITQAALTWPLAFQQIRGAGAHGSRKGTFCALQGN